MNGNDKTDARFTAVLSPPRDGESTSDEQLLRLRAREAIQLHKLPVRQATRASSGPGLGAGCKVCGRPVMHSQRGFEIEFGPNAQDDTDDFGAAGQTHELHDRCYAAWELERRNFETIEGVLPTESDHGTISNREHDTTNTQRGL